MPSKLRNEIIYPLQCTCISYFIPHFVMDIFTYPCLDLLWYRLVKWAPGCFITHITGYVEFLYSYCSHPVVVCGVPGVGKTSIMAMVASLLPDWCDSDDVRVLLRFCGTTRYSSNANDLLKSLCIQIHKLNKTETRIPELPTVMLQGIYSVTYAIKKRHMTTRTTSQMKFFNNTCAWNIFLLGMCISCDAFQLGQNYALFHCICYVCVVFISKSIFGIAGMGVFLSIDRWGGRFPR